MKSWLRFKVGLKGRELLSKGGEGRTSRGDELIWWSLAGEDFNFEYKSGRRVY